MSVDDRLRTALREQAEAFVPPVEAALDTVRARGRRRITAAVALGAAVAAVVALGGAWTVSALVEGDGLTPAQTPTAPATSTSTAGADAPLRGRITADAAEPAVLVGTWTLTLNGNGTMDVAPPASYEDKVSGALFTADTTSFRTRLFQEDLCRGDGTGFYTWLRVGERIEFQVVSDTCAGRSVFFEKASWVVSTEPARRD